MQAIAVDIRRILGRRAIRLHTIGDLTDEIDANYLNVRIRWIIK
jgi:hypothetical protein